MPHLTRTQRPLPAWKAERKLKTASPAKHSNLRLLQAAGGMEPSKAAKARHVHPRRIRGVEAARG